MTLFIINYSNGNEHLQPNRLSMTKTRDNFGGKQPTMRYTQLTSDCLRPFNDELFPLQ